MAIIRYFDQRNVTLISCRYSVFVDICPSLLIFYNLSKMKPLDFFFTRRIYGPLHCVWFLLSLKMDVSKKSRLPTRLLYTSLLSYFRSTAWNGIDTFLQCLLCPNRLCNDNLFVGDVCELATTKRKKDLLNNNTKSQCEFQQHIIPILTLGGTKMKGPLYKKKTKQQSRNKAKIKS